MDIEVHPDGKWHGKGTHVSLFVRVLEGRNDESLPWPLVGNVTFTLLNQLKDEDHLDVN
jgi:hypothetical protein